jgi:hypothetical protein
VSRLKSSNISSNIIVETGVFQAEMEVHLVNDGPVTIIIESKGNSREPIEERQTGRADLSSVTK